MSHSDEHVNVFYEIILLVCVCVCSSFHSLRASKQQQQQQTTTTTKVTAFKELLLCVVNLNGLVVGSEFVARDKKAPSRKCIHQNQNLLFLLLFKRVGIIFPQKTILITLIN